MDEAFLPFNELLSKMSSIDGEIYDVEEGIRLEIDHFVIETPVELYIVTGDDGKVEIGTVPPLYPVETSFQPSYHTIRFTSEKYQA
jgi:hypothetical protein